MSVEIVEKITGEPHSPNVKEYMVPMRDGIELATDVYLPPESDNKAFSAILVRTPYDKSSRYTALSFEGLYYNSRGYVFVAQDVRGKYRSKGDTDPYTYDVADGYDSVEWITQQPWSNGKVGSVGSSYYGYTAWAAVASGHSAIKAAVPQVTGIEMGTSHVASQWSSQIPPLVALNDLLQIWTDNDSYLFNIHWEKDTVVNIISEVREKIGPSIGATHLIERSKHQDWYNPYQDRHPYHTTQVPILHWQNWYDPGLAPSGMRDWRHFRRQPGLRNLHSLHVGSADHSGYKLEDVGKGDGANPYLSDSTITGLTATECSEKADFFDEHINGLKPNKPRARCRWHIGHVGWQETEDFPPQTQPVTLYLSGPRGSHYNLTWQPSEKKSSAAWTHNPSSPVPSTTDIETIWYLLAGYPDERDLESRKDVLTFRSSPLTTDLDFVGQPEFKARITFEGNSTHIFVKLQDVYPDGTTRPLSWGRTVMHKAAGPDLALAMDDNAYRIKGGHSVQLQVQSSDFPHYAVHPGTDESPWHATEHKTKDHSITIGGIDGAMLTLPRYNVPKP